MWNSLRALLSKKSPKSASRAVRQARLELEPLEERQVLSVTNHGGAILSHVEVQAMYYGSDWQNNTTYHNQVGDLDGFLKNVVNSSYMDMLSNAGYGVGRGTFDQGYVRPLSLDKTQYLSDATLHNALVNSINGGNLKAPDGNRLYVIFVEDNVAVMDPYNDTSTAGLLGYHGAFGATIRPPGSLSATSADIHYAVIPYHGGSVPLTSGALPNETHPWLSTLDSLTQTASHELAEAVTDPNALYKAFGWTDDVNGEVGDITQGQTVHLNGYAVQRISDQNDQAITPQGAGPIKAVNFVLSKNGVLYLSSSGLTQIATGIASVSDQGIDNQGHAMVDVVTTTGTAKQYEEGIGWTTLASGVKMAKAGQGVSYVLFTDGTVKETRDAGKTWTYLDSSVTAIDAGTDRYGVNMMVEVWSGQAWEHSDSTGWYYLLRANVKAVSAGQLGNIDLLYTDGSADAFNQASWSYKSLGNNVALVTAGTDENGNAMSEVVDSYGQLWQVYAGGIWGRLGSGVTSISKAHAGVVDEVFSGTLAYSHDDATGFHYLAGNASTAV